MTDTQKAAMEQALEALEQLQGGCTDHNDGTVEAITVWCPEIIDALRAALAEQPAGPDAEPAIPPGYKLVPIQNLVEWNASIHGDYFRGTDWELETISTMPIAAAPEAPQPAKREPLTDAEIGQVRWQCRWNRMSTDDNVVYATTQQLDAFARAVIAAHERKNGIGGQA